MLKTILVISVFLLAIFISFFLGISVMKRGKEQKYLWFTGVFSWICALATLLVGIFLVIYGINLGPDTHSSPNGSMYTVVGGIMMVASGLLATLAAKLEQERRSGLSHLLSPRRKIKKINRE